MVFPKNNASEILFRAHTTLSMALVICLHYHHSQQTIHSYRVMWLHMETTFKSEVSFRFLVTRQSDRLTVED